eukprot:2113756-Pyramimonas_sp.AAC.1
MGHWFAMNELSRGLRDRVTDFLAAQGGARELARACYELKIAHDLTTPGTEKQNAVAERANGVVQVGTRALLMQAGLPPPYWTYAVRYFTLCYNTRIPEEGQSSWERRFGCRFEAPLLPFGSPRALCASAWVQIQDRRDRRRDDSGDIFGVYSNILDGTAEDQYPKFHLRTACEKAVAEVRSVAIPPAGEAAAVPDGPQPATGIRSDN